MPAVPAFVNPKSGSADAALAALRNDSRVDVRETTPDELQDAIRSALETDPPVILVAGGDGTISSAASVAAGTRTALCILRAGTLNHFARRMGIPTDPRKAIELAFEGRTRRIDVGHVNDRIFLNTCVIGLYVEFVRRREELDPRFGYVISSAAAALKTLAVFGNRGFDLWVNGEAKRRESALIFVGVGERDFRIPVLGEPKEAGQNGLHVAIVQPLSRPQLAQMTVRAAVRGVGPWPSDEHVDSFIVDDFVLAFEDGDTRLTLDGEIFQVDNRLRFHLERSELTVCTPPDGGHSTNS